jgi:hypothetical protein
VFATVVCVGIICIFHIISVNNIFVIFVHFERCLGLGTSTYCMPTGLNSLGLVCPEIRVHLVACATPPPFGGHFPVSFCTLVVRGRKGGSILQ